VVPLTLTEQIPIVTPVRTRVGDQCTPDCPETAPEFFSWTIRVNGENAHSFNANRISLLIPKPGEIEHWTYINGGGWVAQVALSGLITWRKNRVGKT